MADSESQALNAAPAVAVENTDTVLDAIENAALQTEPVDEPNASASQADGSDTVAPGGEDVADEDLDAPVTRRNWREHVARLEKEAEAKIEAALQRERDAHEQRQRTEAALQAAQQQESQLTEEMLAFTGRDDEIAELRSQAMRPIPVVDDPYDTEQLQAQREAIQSQARAFDRLSEIEKNRSLLPKMFARVRGAFNQGVHDVFDTVAKTHDGVDPKVFVEHLMADSGPEEGAARLRDALSHLYQAGKAKGESEWRSKYEAERAAHAATKAGAGGAVATPESPGRVAAPSGRLTPDKYAQMSYAERAKLRETPEGRASIDNMFASG